MNDGAVERLHFVKGGGGYDSHLAAQHLVRYSLLRDHVKGQRVLDIACGEGYGSRLLADWGAKSVVGIDNSPAALDVANKTFKDEKIRFLLGNAEDAASLFGKGEKFDVIVSFETIEHLKAPLTLLHAIQALRATNSIVAVSCPNDAVFHGDAAINHYHERRYTFQEFKEMSESVLGAASVWLLGAPIIGECNIEHGDLPSGVGRSDWLSIMDATPVQNALRLPASTSMTLSERDCSHYLGVWGERIKPNAALATQSVSNFLDPWRALEWFKAQHTGLRNEVELLRAEKSRLSNEVQRLRHKVMNLLPKLEALKADRAKLQKLRAKVDRSLVVKLPKRVVRYFGK